MANNKLYPYSPVPNSLKRILNKIPTIGTPPKATQEWLASIGFSGGNNKRGLAVMRQVGIIGSGGEPTEMWDALRAGDKAAFAAGLRKHYSELFATYPDAHRKDDEALIAFIRSKTNYAEQAQRLAARTFKVLSEFGDFDQGAASKNLQETPAKTNGGGKESPRERSQKTTRESASGTTPPVALTVNLQLQLPPSADGEVYDKLFAAMGKHLKGLITTE